MPGLASRRSLRLARGSCGYLSSLTLKAMDYFSKFLRTGNEAPPKTTPDYAQEFHKSWTFVKVADAWHRVIAIL